jgi:hypothetical protein
MCVTLQLLQKLVVSADLVGEALVPYYRQILPIFNLYKNWNKNIGDGIDYAQKNYDCLGELVADTLSLFEQKGGDDAFINIKYMVRLAKHDLHDLPPTCFTYFTASVANLVGDALPLGTLLAITAEIHLFVS